MKHGGLIMSTGHLSLIRKALTRAVRGSARVVETLTQAPSPRVILLAVSVERVGLVRVTRVLLAVTTRATFFLAIFGWLLGFLRGACKGRGCYLLHGCRAHWGALIIVRWHGRRYVMRLMRHRRGQGRAPVLGRWGAELLLAVVRVGARDATSSLVRGASRIVGIGRVARVMVVVEVVVVAAATTTCTIVSTAHATLRRNRLVVHVVTLVRVSPQVRRLRAKGVRVLRHRGCSHVGSLRIEVSYVTK